MFHQGDIRSGISLAVQQSKAVICFVYGAFEMPYPTYYSYVITDACSGDDENSQAWENTIVMDEQVCSGLQILLTVVEISYPGRWGNSNGSCRVTNSCRLPRSPISLFVLLNRCRTKYYRDTVGGPHPRVQQSLIHVRNGATKAVISHTASTQDQLGTRILALLDSSLVPSDRRVIEVTNTDNTVAGAASSGRDEAAQRVATQLSNPEALNPPFPAAVPQSDASQHDEQHVLNGGNAEVESASAQDFGSEASSGTTVPSTSSGRVANPPTKSTPQQNWARMQRERERQQREERERIKTQIKHDHAERRLLDDLRRLPAIDLTPSEPRMLAQATLGRPSSSDVRIQVRSFDGSTIRSKFPQTASISGEVRPWIDSSWQGVAPYNLKMILTPQANRTIEAAEEEKSLEDLDIFGSCTLVMVPVKGFVESYAPTGSGIFGSTVSGGYRLLSGSVGAVFGGVRSLLGVGQVTSETPAQCARDTLSSPAPPGQMRVRTLADQRIEAAKKDQQFYNGNQLNFEPRKDDESEE
jgi:UBX domain